MRVYHLDRSNLLTSGKHLSLDTTIKIDPSLLQNVLESNFPSGVSRHGDTYYTRQATQQNAGHLVYESIFEYERKLHFPNSISRFQSFFGLKNETDVNHWLLKLSNNNPQQAKKIKVWEVDTLDSAVQKYDASFLAGGSALDLSSFSPLVASYWANKYWSGELSEHPSIELLISPEVRIIKPIKTSKFL